MTPVDARKTSAILQPDRLGGDLGGDGASLAAVLAGKRIGVAGIDHERTGAAALDPGAAPLDRRRGHFERVNTPATLVPASNTASSTSVRPW